MFKISENGLELRKLFRSNARKDDSKAIAINPAHGGFINPQWPIKPRNVEPKLKFGSLFHLHIAFDLATTDRNIQSPSLPLLPLARKSAAKLRCESRLYPPVFWPGLRRRLFGAF